MRTIGIEKTVMLAGGIEVIAGSGEWRLTLSKLVNVNCVGAEAEAFRISHDENAGIAVCKRDRAYARSREIAKRCRRRQRLSRWWRRGCWSRGRRQWCRCGRLRLRCRSLATTAEHGDRECERD